MKKLRHVSPGQPITASLMNQLIDGFNQLQGLGVAAPLQMMHLPGGVQIGLNQSLPKQSLFEVVSLAGSTPGDGTGADDIFYWNARQVSFTADGLYESTVPGAGTTHTLYDPLRVYAGSTLARWHPAFFNTYTGHWEILPGYVGGKWAKATTRWVNGDRPYVDCHPCRNALGQGEDTSVVVPVVLPKLAGRDPNIRAGDVIAYTQVGDGSTQVLYLCISNYLDDKLGTIKPYIGSLPEIPAGWALADGVANSVANGGSGRNLSGRFLVGYEAGHGDYFQVGNTGGSTQHGHTIGLFAGNANFASNNPGFVTAQSDHRPPWYTVAFIERIL